MTGKNKIVIVGLLASLAALVVKHVRLVRWLGIYAQANEHLTARVEELKAEKDARKRGLIPIEEHPEFRAMCEKYGEEKEAREYIKKVIEGFPWKKKAEPSGELMISRFSWNGVEPGRFLDEINGALLAQQGLRIKHDAYSFTEFVRLWVENIDAASSTPPKPLENIKESNFRIDEIPGADIRPAIALLRKYLDRHGVGIAYERNPAGWFDVRLFSKKEAEVGYDEKTGHVVVSATMFVSPEDWPEMQAQAFLGMFSDKVLSRFGLRALVTRNAVTGVGISVERAGQPSRPAPREGNVAVESSGGIQTS